MTAESTEPAPPPGCPAHGLVKMYGHEFAADPHGTYARLREHGQFAPVEIAPGVPATLAIGYDAVLEMLRDDRTFLNNPSEWQKTVPPDCPVLPMMGYRPNALFADGTVHARLRGAILDSFARLDTATLRRYVERSADTLLQWIGPHGQADIQGEYAMALPVLVFMELFGCPSDISEKIVSGMSGIFEAIDAEKANAELAEGIMELVAHKRARPGEDITSWLMAHPARLTDEEMAHQLTVLLGGGIEPAGNLISGALRLLLSDDRFAGDLSGGSVPIEDALDEVLWTDPPIANYAARYPVRDVELAGHLLPADRPVVISFAAANTDPSKAGEQRVGNRAHLAWGAGPHLCPVREEGRLIASIALEKLLDGLPDMELAVPVEELEWRPGMFHRAPVSMPVRFPPVHTPEAPKQEHNARPVTPMPDSRAAHAPVAQPSGLRRLVASVTRWWRGD
ncbi:Cytochrome P450 [Thermomonospora echinospora]|uniref:Cytochrome P450 n=1 Tax=Thermomonospora echinospora TaxID=1992 RepID=A0A1H6E2W4_9ACTN|nr:cytochrome P450 [Thermomonospora echinospora]SEG92058.1 Cytochrome P450 [Thermomonospora echinospora]